MALVYFQTSGLAGVLYDPLLYTRDSSIPAPASLGKLPSPLGLHPEDPCFCLGQHPAVAASRARLSVHLSPRAPGQERKPRPVPGSGASRSGRLPRTAPAARRSLPSCRHLAFQALLGCFIASFQGLAGADVVPAAARSSWLLASEMRDLSPLDSWAGSAKQACWGVSAFCRPFFFA